MAYRVVALDSTSSAIAEIDDALDFARSLIEDGVDVLRIEDAAGAVVRDAGEVAAWCAARPRKRARAR